MRGSPAAEHAHRTLCAAGRAGHLRLQLQRLRHEELLEAVATELAAVTGLLVAAERGERVEGAAVDLDLACADPGRDALRALLVRRPYAAGQAVDRVVRDPDRILLAVVRHDREHGAED